MKTGLCKFCGKPVHKRRKWQEFCNDLCRWRHWIELHPRTRLESKGNPDPCYYCGLPASTVDHVPPKVMRQRIEELGLKARYEYHEVKACHECNSALGARAILTLPERKRFMKAWLRRRYRRLLRIPAWSDSEIAQLGYTLRTSVLSHILASEVIKARIGW